MKYLAFVTLLAGLCAAQDAPIKLETDYKNCEEQIGSQRYFKPCYGVKYINLSDRVIVGIKIAVDEVDAVGDKRREVELTCCSKWRLKLKPGKAEKVQYSRVFHEKYENPRPVAVRFEDGTVWRAPEHQNTD